MDEHALPHVRRAMAESVRLDGMGTNLADVLADCWEKVQDQERRDMLRRMRQVQTYRDLVQTNMEFMEGKLMCSLYSVEPWGGKFQTSDHKEDNGRAQLDLARLFQAYTYSGEAPWCGDQFEGRSYLCTYLPVRVVRAVLPALCKDSTIQCWVTFPDGTRQSSCPPATGPPEPVPVTMVNGVVEAAVSPYDDTAVKQYADKEGLTTIVDLLDDAAHLCVVATVWCDHTADSILLHHLQTTYR
jgi:hypothetical protein